MIKKILTFSLIFSVFRCFSADLVVNQQFTTFLKVLGKVESSNNPRAFNKSENAIGIYQIRKLYFIDAQRINPELKKYKHEDCFNVEISKLVVKAYLSRYCKENNMESWARCHNSGPNWKNKFNLTNKYWARFEKLSVTVTNK